MSETSWIKSSSILPSPNATEPDEVLQDSVVAAWRCAPRWDGRGEICSSGSHTTQVSFAVLMASVMESAGINRHGDGDGRALHRRSSDPWWPRAMRWRPARAQRSVSQGTHRPAIEPRNGVDRGADVVMTGGRQHRWWRYSRAARGPREVGEPVHVLNLHAREPGDPTIALPPETVRAARGRPRPHARDARSWEVGLPHSRRSRRKRPPCGCGDGGGKGAARGERGQQNAPRTQSRSARKGGPYRDLSSTPATADFRARRSAFSSWPSQR